MAGPLSPIHLPIHPSHSPIYPKPTATKSPTHPTHQTHNPTTNTRTNPHPHQPTRPSGYIQRYAHNNTYPRLRRWISIHGPLLGVAGLPGCNRTRVGLCNEADSLVDIAAYSALLQAHLAQVHTYAHAPRLDVYILITNPHFITQSLTLYKGRLLP